MDGVGKFCRHEPGLNGGSMWSAKLCGTFPLDYGGGGGGGPVRAVRYSWWGENLKLFTYRCKEINSRSCSLSCMNICCILLQFVSSIHKRQAYAAYLYLENNVSL